MFLRLILFSIFFSSCGQSTSEKESQINNLKNQLLALNSSNSAITISANDPIIVKLNQSGGIESPFSGCNGFKIRNLDGYILGCNQSNSEVVTTFLLLDNELSQSGTTNSSIKLLSLSSSDSNTCAEDGISIYGFVNETQFGVDQHQIVNLSNEESIDFVKVVPNSEQSDFTFGNLGFSCERFILEF